MVRTEPPLSLASDTILCGYKSLVNFPYRWLPSGAPTWYWKIQIYKYANFQAQWIEKKLIWAVVSFQDPQASFGWNAAQHPKCRPAAWRHTLLQAHQSGHGNKWHTTLKNVHMEPKAEKVRNPFVRIFYRASLCGSGQDTVCPGAQFLVTPRAWDWACFIAETSCSTFWKRLGKKCLPHQFRWRRSPKWERHWLGTCDPKPNASLKTPRIWKLFDGYSSV